MQAAHWTHVDSWLLRWTTFCAFFSESVIFEAFDSSPLDISHVVCLLHLRKECGSISSEFLAQGADLLHGLLVLLGPSRLVLLELIELFITVAREHFRHWLEHLRGKLLYVDCLLACLRVFRLLMR